MVIKIGTNLITAGKECLNKELMMNIASQVRILFQDGWKVVLVSSGAVALGRKRINEGALYRQRAAARGQHLLMAAWQEIFSRHSIEVDQLLFSRKNFIRQIEVLKAIDDGVAILNGDDTVYDPDFAYEDNDDLTADIALAIKADIVVILCDVFGLLNEKGKHLKTVSPFENLLKRGVHYREKNVKGVGGPEMKHRNASRVASQGIWTAITCGKLSDVLIKASRREQIGTIYKVA